MRALALLAAVVCVCACVAAAQETPAEEIGGGQVRTDLTTAAVTEGPPPPAPTTGDAPSEEVQAGGEQTTTEVTAGSTTEAQQLGDPTPPEPTAAPTAEGRTIPPAAEQLETGDGESSDCDFSESTCWWRPDGAPYRHYSWRRGSPQTAFYLGGPDADAAGEQGADAGYAFVDASVFRDVNIPDFYLSAWLTSPTRPPPGPAGRCLRFMYNTAGASVHSMRVLRIDHVPTVYLNRTRWPRDDEAPPPPLYAEARNASETTVANATGRAYIMRQQNVTETLWEARDATDGAWREGKVTYNTGYEHRLVFEVVPQLAAQAGRGYVAVDDVSLAEGACDDDCGFEDDLCRWSNAADDDFDWLLGRGSRKKVTGPIRDQSSSRSYSRIGGYTFADSSHPRRPGDQARLESAVFETVEPLCLGFLHQYVRRRRGPTGRAAGVGGGTPRTRTLWQVDGGSGSQLSWELGHVTLASPDRFKVQLEATVGEPGAGDIAVDSLRVEAGACPTLPASAGGDGDASCAFRDDTCGWTLGGPPDHFLSFAVSGYEHQAGARDRVLSPEVRDRPRVCFSFWVHLASHIATMPRLGSLQVILVNASNNASAPLWRVDNHLRHGWVRAQAAFSASAPVRLALEAVRGSGVSGVLGVDDVVIHDGDCATLPAAAAVSPLDCWFDVDECGWTVAAAEGESWRAAATGYGVPQLLDHTHRVETGYEYFDPFNQRATARLVSAEVPAGQRLCLSLWYTCIGGVQDDASLSVRRQGGDNGTAEVLWQVTQGRSGHTGRRYTWHYGQVAVQAAERAARLEIQAIGMQAGFAIDDVRTVTGEAPCSVRPDWARPAPPP
ncbi:LOW QUALITY PROTEIN: MAM and LDL-receptor class A domain-containing protein 1-like [Pollicipes pollicipes]|uniref:LOW QUALITY PROTEIN: MAM and LDL-receptor class A domain-containing protein 1-like n=1 Tax=Pollicipes pollicipes TaxID=41117 RepID=UPI0018857F91|nr:LOW QUALITY PROTEIN: MAM and LDL-receptor class A domain-containing protein 1-like [Pollicipes pollicipes]